MRKRILLAAAVLLFVGAGCAGGQPAAPAPTSGGQVPSAAKPADPVDQAVNGIVGDEQKNADATDQETSDGAQLDATQTEVNAFSDSNYGIQ